MNDRSKSSLFLMEQLVVIIVFAICATACVKIFVGSYLTTVQARDISQALLAAENGAEAYKAAAGDTARLAEILGAERKDAAGLNAVRAYYDAAWQACGEAEAVYTLIITAKPASKEPYAPLCADLTVEKRGGGELVAFTVAAGGKQDE